jgi:hypothetical protein
VTLLIVRSVLRGGRALAVGLAMAVAVAGIDLAYAIVGLSGVGRLLNGGSALVAGARERGNPRRRRCEDAVARLARAFRT